MQELPDNSSLIYERITGLPECADKLILETILQDKFFISRRRKEA